MTQFQARVTNFYFSDHQPVDPQTFILGFFSCRDLCLGGQKPFIVL